MHCPAFFGAATAYFGAFAAVLIIMPAALGSAGITGICAQAAKHHRAFAAHAHQLRAGIAQRRALHIQPDALRHHGHVRFFKTGCRTMIAHRCTGQAGVYALFIFVISLVFHFLLLERIMQKDRTRQCESGKNTATTMDITPLPGTGFYHSEQMHTYKPACLQIDCTDANLYFYCGSVCYF
jgi:hypothetical protein